MTARRAAAAVGAAVLLVSAVSACGLGASPPPGCPTEPRAVGTLPDLEALLPAGLRDVSVDSGWNCLPATLRSYARHGVTRLEFAGATSNEGAAVGFVIAVFRSGTGDPALQAAWVEEFYEGSARESGRVDNIETRRELHSPTVETWRMDALNGLSLQSTVVWQDGPVVRMVIVASDVGPNTNRADHDAMVTGLVSFAAVAPDPSSVPADPTVLPSAA